MDKPLLRTLRELHFQQNTQSPMTQDHWLTYQSFLDHLNDNADHRVSANGKIWKMFQEACGDVRLNRKIKHILTGMSTTIRPIHLFKTSWRTVGLSLSPSQLL